QFRRRLVTFGRNEGQFAYGSDARKRLAPESQRFDMEQVGIILNFTRRMAQKCPFTIDFAHAVAVIGDCDLFQSGFLQRHFNVRAVSVDAVFNEFFDDGSGTFDDFASGYFIRQRFGKLMNFHRSSIPFSRSSFKSFSMFNASSGVISLMLSDFIFSMALASASVDGLFFRSSST